MRNAIVHNEGLLDINLLSECNELDMEKIILTPHKCKVKYSKKFLLFCKRKLSLFFVKHISQLHNKL